MIQWGFLGGLVYTSIDLLYRFLRKDLSPQVYFNSSFKLIFSAVTAIVIYFLYLSSGYPNVDKTPPPYWLLLLVFLAGVAPIQILINFADRGISRIYRGWSRKTTAGNKPIVQLEGINSIIAGRLSEEGIDYIQQMALCNPVDLASKTKFQRKMTEYWKDQAILYLLVGDVIIIENQNCKKYLNDLLEEKLGIRTMSALLDLWKDIKDDDKETQKSFFRSIDPPNYDETKLDRWYYLFKNIINQGDKLRDRKSVLKGYSFIDV